MFFENWILPLLIGIIAAFMLMNIVYNNPKLKQTFSDLGAFIQLQTSRPYYNGIGWVPVNYDYVLPQSPPLERITSVDSPLYPEGSLVPPVYNYFPETPLIPMTVENHSVPSHNARNNLAFNPHIMSKPYDSYYYGFTGYPYPIQMYPPTNIDKVRGIESKM